MPLIESSVPALSVAICTSAAWGTAPATAARLSSTWAALGIQREIAPAATATTAPIPASRKNARRLTVLVRPVVVVGDVAPAAAIGWSAPVRTTLPPTAGRRSVSGAAAGVAGGVESGVRAGVVPAGLDALRR